MHGQKKRRKHPDGQPITVDGFELCWALYSEPQFTTEHGYKGLRVTVRMAEGAHRELMLEYPFPKKKPNGMAHLQDRAKISPLVVEAGIRQAMAAGWNPVSRGKTLTYKVPETN